MRSSDRSRSNSKTKLPKNRSSNDFRDSSYLKAKDSIIEEDEEDAAGTTKDLKHYRNPSFGVKQ